jgi:AhpD family alkylhydroperoxidase
MSFLAEHFEEYTKTLNHMDEVLKANSPIDDKTDEMLRFALSIKARSAPCVRKHYKGAIKAGVTKQEIAYIFALTMREAAGADDCWTHSIIADLIEAPENSACGCD